MVLAPHRGAKTRARARHPEAPGAGPAPDSDAAGDAKPSPN
jgi:translation initiation factor IF-3